MPAQVSFSKNFPVWQLNLIRDLHVCLFHIAAKCWIITMKQLTVTMVGLTCVWQTPQNFFQGAVILAVGIFYLGS